MSPDVWLTFYAQSYIAADGSVLSLRVRMSITCGLVYGKKASVAGRIPRFSKSGRRFDARFAVFEIAKKTQRLPASAGSSKIL
jgi:hypothetical protein